MRQLSCTTIVTFVVTLWAWSEGEVVVGTVVAVGPVVVVVGPVVVVVVDEVVVDDVVVGVVVVDVGAPVVVGPLVTAIWAAALAPLAAAMARGAAQGNRLAGDARRQGKKNPAVAGLFSALVCP